MMGVGLGMRTFVEVGGHVIGGVEYSAGWAGGPQREKWWVGVLGVGSASRSQALSPPMFTRAGSDDVMTVEGASMICARVIGLTLLSKRKCPASSRFS